MTEIHPTAIIHPGARIGPECTIGAYSIVGANVVLGAGNRVGAHVVLEGHTQFGDENQIFQFASIGSAPQDLKYRGEASRLEIGHRNIVREYVTIQPGTSGGGMLTSVGNQNLFMANSHLGHDGKIGDGNVIANSAAIAGHATIGSGVIIGGLSGIHQFVHLGDGCLIGAGAMVSKDVPPYCTAQGDRAHLIGLNLIGLERRKTPREQIVQLKRLYRELFLGDGAQRNRVEQARRDYAGFELGMKLIEFVAASERGVTFPAKRRSGSVSEAEE